jgi:catechol 2,3-dioxygenase-like lactoylglutathione lyase family enzyme
MQMENDMTEPAPLFRSSPDVIVCTELWADAVKFYETVLGLPVTHRSGNIVGFDAGGFCLYVERGPEHGPVFEFLVSDVTAAKRHLLAHGCLLVEEDASVPRCYVRDPCGLTFNIGLDTRPP